MNWSDLSKNIADFAPVLGSLVGGPVGSAAGALIAAKFGTSNTPDAISTAISTDPEASLKLKQLEIDLQAKQLETSSALQQAKIQSQSAETQAVNKTMQVEEESMDPYVRRWRPTIGYIIGIVFGFNLIIMPILLVIFQCYHSAESLQLMNEVIQYANATQNYWIAAMAVLGVNIHSRSKDKQYAKGIASTPWIQIKK